MKILMINSFLGPSGETENAIYATTNILKKNNHDVFFFATDKKPFFEEDYELANYFPEYINYSSLSKLDLAKNIPKIFYNFEAEYKLDALIKRLKPDIAHINYIQSILTPSVINACHKNKVPVVMTLYDTSLFCPGINLMYKSEYLCKTMSCLAGNPISCISNRCFEKSLIKSSIAAAEFIFRRIHNLYGKVSVFICPIQIFLDLAIKAGIEPNKLVTVSNFIDEAYFQIEPEYTNKGYFLYVGKLAKENDVKTLINAMSILPKEIKLHIVGTGAEKNSLKILSKQLNLNNVKFVGFKKGQELAEEYKNCIATILPSKCFEIFGLTIVESFTYGKPIIASNIGAIPEIVENNKNGLLFTPENSYELAKAIIKLYNDHKLSKSMGQEGRKKAEILYNPDLHYQKLIKIYESIVR